MCAEFFETDWLGISGKLLPIISAILVPTILWHQHRLLKKQFHLLEEKRKDDLFKLRFEFYGKVKKIWGKHGFFYELKSFYDLRKQGKIMKLEGCTAHESSRNYRKTLDKLNEIKKDFPDFLINFNNFDNTKLAIFFVEARFLFDEEFAIFLVNIVPHLNLVQNVVVTKNYSVSQAFEVLEEYWDPTTFNHPVKKKFDQYLKLNKETL